MVIVEDGRAALTVGLPWLAVGVGIGLTAWRRNLFLGVGAAVVIAAAGRAVGLS